MAGPVTGGLNPFGFWQQPGQWGRNEQGNFTLWRFEGTRREIFALAASFAQTEGINYQVSEGFGKWAIEVRFPYSMNGIDPKTDLVETWEFFAQHAEKDILDSTVENPNTIAQLTRQQVQAIRHYIDNPPQGTTADPFPTAATFILDSGTDGTLAFDTYTLMVQGVRNFPVEQPMLRRTIITSDQYAIAYVLQNVGKILSTATLTSLENLPGALLFNLPNGVSSDITRAYGWYKTFPTVQQIALLKWQIVQEWQYGLWSTFIWSPIL